MESPDERGVSQVIVIGASAGGVNALSVVVSGLPREFSVPIVIAQHLDPRQPSHLEEILSARTGLPVKTVVAEEPLTPGTIFVVPAGRNVEVMDHRVRVMETDGGPRPSIDRLLESAARSFGDDLIAVILSGFGADGAVGAQIVKALGGTVIIENPESAAFPSMPGHVPTPSVDIVADLEEIGPLLVDLVSGRYAVSVIEENEELTTLLTRVRERSGLDFGAYKRPTIERRLQRRMAAIGMRGVADYRRYLERHPEELQRLVASFLIKVTEFFRDPELFSYMRERVLPDLIAEARRRDGELRIWSAGCATGEEAYTLAILVADLLGARGDEDLPVRIFATDVATDAIDYARRGMYPDSALANLPPDLIQRYFTTFDGLYEVRKSLRQMVIFGDHDLSHRAPFPRTDLVLCRNVLIYFTSELQRRVLERFAFSLRQGGYLALGKSESVSPLPDFYNVEQPGLKVFRRIGESIPIPVSQLLSDSAARPHDRVAFGRQLPARRNLTVGSPLYPEEDRLTAPEAGHLLDMLPMGVVVVDRRYDIQSLNVPARRLLGVHVASSGEDLIHRLPASLTQTMRSAIDAAFKGERTSLIHDTGPDVLDDEDRYVRISCAPVESTSPGTDPTFVIVVVDDVTEMTRRQRELERAAERSERSLAEVRSLRQSTESMAIEFGHLRAQNDVLQIANEEVQAAAEEIEALNEEAQAANEELETLNEELQATVEELRTANDELQARGTELQLLATAHEEERERLEAVLAAIGDAVLVIDRQGRPAMTNAAYQRIFGEEEAFVPEDESGQQIPVEARPQARAARGESIAMTFSAAGINGERRWFEATGLPLERQGTPYGGVLTIRDITDRSLLQLQDRWLAAATHELRSPLAALQALFQLTERQKDPERIKQALERARGQIRRMTNLVDDLIDTSHLRSGRLPLDRRRVDLAEIAAEAVTTARLLAQGQTIELTPAPEPLTVDVDPGRLEQVVLNLLTNAITYARGTDRIDLLLRRDDHMAELEVRDQGPGIGAEDLDRIFDRYFQSESTQQNSHSGLGLGLFIAREIVTDHGGTIAASSTDGSGTRITIRLPLLVNPDQQTTVDRAL